ncbi:MAG: cytochrome c3 family protein [Planctomycetota bacterium]|jgi:hypothetical protein
MHGATHLKVFLGTTLVLGMVAIVATGDARPLNVHTGYAPEQPIEYSHRLHAGELGMDCLYCHYGARTSKHAGIPPAGVCMRCHKTVSASFDVVYTERELAVAEEREPRRIVSEPIARLYRAMGLDEDLEPLPGGPEPLEWVKVHNLPDFVAFDHSVHVSRGLSCEECHGPVSAMERLRQESDLSMGWCLDCHRSRAADPTLVLKADHGRLPAGDHVSTDCAACHY